MTFMLGVYENRADAINAQINYLLPRMGLGDTEMNKNKAWRQSKAVFKTKKSDGEFKVYFK